MNVKLIGTFVQHVEVELMPGEEFYCERGAVIYLQQGIAKEPMLNGRGLGRILGAKISGESLILLRLYNNCGMPRKVTIGSRACLVPVKIQNETIICQRGAYVASSRRVDVSTKLSLTGMIGGMGLILQKISGDATLFLDSIGTPMTLDLQPGEVVELDENHIIALQGIDEGRMRSNWSASGFISGEGLSMLQVTGPGRVYLSPGRMIETKPG